MSNFANILLVILLIIFGFIILIVSFRCLIWIIVVLNNILDEIIKPFIYSCCNYIRNGCNCFKKDTSVILCVINEECAICIADNNSNSISLKCNHGYHRECIRGWVQQCNKQENTPRCPLCKDHIMLDISTIILGK